MTNAIETTKARLEDVHSAVANLRRGPALELLSRVLDHLPRHPVEVARFYVLESVGGPQLAAVRGVGDVRPGTPDDIPRICALEGKSASKFAARFDRGDQCLVAMANGELVGYEWFSENRPFVDEGTAYPVQVPSDGIFAYDGYVRADYRGRGTFIRLQGGAREFMRSRKAQRMLTMVFAENEPSLSAHLRLGFRPIRTVWSLGLMGHHYFVEQQPPS